MKNIDDLLKNAIANNDIHFLTVNKDKYNINHRFLDEDNDTLLSYAISDSGSNAYCFFIENGADVTLINDEGESIIHSIVYSGAADRLLYLLKMRPDAVNLIDNQSFDGTPPLLLSVLLNKETIFNLLLDLGASVNLTDKEGNSPIHPACLQGYKDMIIRLVEKGANLHLKTNNGNYPLALAVNGDQDDIVKYLFNLLYR